MTIKASFVTPGLPVIPRQAALPAQVGSNAGVTPAQR